MFERPSHRKPNEMRPVRFTTHYTKHAEGSVLSGIWSLDWDGYTNSFMFNQTVPEPAVFAVVLGGLALFFALRNGRRPRSR